MNWMTGKLMRCTASTGAVLAPFSVWAQEAPGSITFAPVAPTAIPTLGTLALSVPASDSAAARIDCVAVTRGPAAKSAAGHFTVTE